jgi:hypothetical protein
MTSNNGSVFSWSPSPTKIIQALAPGFHEIERNIWYVEREDEFEESFSDDGTGIMEIDSDFGLMPLDEKQKKLSVTELDIDNCSEECLSPANYMQTLSNQKPELRSLNVLFDLKPAKMSGPQDYILYVPAHASCKDNIAEMAEKNLIELKKKFESIL